MSKDYFNQPFWGGEWTELFEEYLNSVNSFTGFLPEKQTKAQQWQKAMEFWWNTMKPDMPEFANPTASRLMEQAKTFYFLGQHFMELLEKLSTSKQGSDAYLQHLANQIESMKAVINASQTIGHYSINDVLDAWQLPGDTWGNLLKNIPGVDKDITRALKADELDSFMDRYLNLPGVGYAREFQEKIQKNVVLLKQFLKSSEEYNEIMGQVGIQALDGLRDRIVEMSKNGEEITSLRQLYNIWVDCNEEAYASFVFSKEYSELYGNLVNTLTAYKKQSNEIRDEFLQASSLPTRSDLEAMQKQTAGLIKKLNKAIARSRNDALRIEELEVQLAGLKTSDNTSKPVKASVTARNTTRPGKKIGKKVTRKKISARKKKADSKIVDIKSAKSKTAKNKSQSKSGKESGKKTIEIKF